MAHDHDARVSRPPRGDDALPADDDRTVPPGRVASSDVVVCSYGGGASDRPMCGLLPDPGGGDRPERGWTCG